MAGISKERMGEIALLLVKERLRRDGVKLRTNLKRSAGEQAKAIGISTEEFMTFAKVVVAELYNEAFA